MTVWPHMLRLCLVAFVVALGLAGTGQAQVTEANRQFYQEWLSTAERAENAVDARRASEAAYEALRLEISGFRTAFHKERTKNTERILTLESQLSALGPKPEGDGEPEDIANLRVSLNNSLNQLRVPQVISDEAYNRANGLIAEIDLIIRERRNKELLVRYPSPLNPEHWPVALREISDATKAITNETAQKLNRATTVEKIKRDLPVIVVLLSLSLVLLFRGRPLSKRAGDYFRSLGGKGSGVWTFLVSVAEVFVLFFGLILLVAAIQAMDVLGVRGTLVIDSVPGWGLTFLLFHWLANRLVPRHEGNNFLPVVETRRRETRFLIELLALMLVLHDAGRHFEQVRDLTDATRSVIAFPLILLSATILLRLRWIRVKHVETPEEKPGETKITAGANRLVDYLRYALYFLSLASPVLAALGYVNAAEAIIFPAMQTLAVLASFVIFQRFLSDLYGWLSGKGEAARDSLAAVLFGFGLGLVVLPILALIWGMRIADLTELWTQFMGGFRIGETTIAPKSIILFAMVFGAGYAATKFLQGSLRNSLLPKTSIDPGVQNAVVAGTGYVGIFLAAVVAITWAGLDLSGLAIVAGALSVGIGFGLQTIVSNFVSGIILLIERPVSKGDWIEVGGLMGYVRDISVRSTRIETFDRTDVIVPNSDLITGTVTNYTRGNTVGRVIVPVGVAYGTDPRKVEAILSKIANAHPMVLANPAPTIVFQGFGADSLDFEIRAILRDVNWVLSVRSDMNYDIAKRFEEEGIEIPFAQRDIWLRNPETLTGATADLAPGQPVPAEPPDADNPGDHEDDG